MRRLRITVALAVVACVVGALASPALANKEKPKAFFGEFVASVPTGGPITPSTPATAKSKEGSLGTFSIGSANHPLFTFECEKVRSEGKVTEERSTDFKTEVKFGKCLATRRLSEKLIERNLKAKIGPGLEFEFHANGGVGVGHELSNEARITKGTAVTVSVKGSQCTILIPAQTVPKNGLNEEKEFEGGLYSGERESTDAPETVPRRFQGTDRSRLGTDQDAGRNPRQIRQQLRIRSRTRREIQP